MKTLREVLHRARSFVGKGCRYRLGAGGRSRFLPDPWDELQQCDCSGFVAGVLEVDRYLPNTPWYDDQLGQWLETTAIVRDAHSPFGFWDPVSRLLVQPGHVIVYGDRDGRQGHIGFVSRVTPEHEVAAVIHCSAGNDRNTGDAIRETDPSVFLRNGAMFVRCAFVDEGDPWPEIPGVTPTPSRGI